MNILIDELPESVWIDGKEYMINSGFRTSILFSLLMFDPEFDGQEKIVQAIKLYYPVPPRDLQQGVENILEFYKCGQPEPKTTGTGKKSAGQIYSFEHDALYIYSAFMQQYHIDLNTADLHWWKFKAMFDTLADNTMITKIMGYRAIEITGDMPKEQQKMYRELKEQYALPKNIPHGEQERLAAINAALMGDGNVQELLRGGND